MPTDLTLYRPNVGLALFNAAGDVLIAKRRGLSSPYAWQMPQGGIDSGESPEDAARRELAEEIGVRPEQADLIGSIADWLVYDFPPEVRLGKAVHGRASWLGQRQRWFAFRFRGEDADIDLEADGTPEFDAWRWERLDATPSLVIPWKRPVYETVAAAFAGFALPE